jgi:hypothetical protein
MFAAVWEEDFPEQEFEVFCLRIQFLWIGVSDIGLGLIRFLLLVASNQRA